MGEMSKTWKGSFSDAIVTERDQIISLKELSEIKEAGLGMNVASAKLIEKECFDGRWVEDLEEESRQGRREDGDTKKTREKVEKQRTDKGNGFSVENSISKWIYHVLWDEPQQQIHLNALLISALAKHGGRFHRGGFDVPISEAKTQSAAFLDSSRGHIHQIGKQVLVRHKDGSNGFSNHIKNRKNPGNDVIKATAPGWNYPMAQPMLPTAKGPVKRHRAFEFSLPNFGSIVDVSGFRLPRTAKLQVLTVTYNKVPNRKFSNVFISHLETKSINA